jgi:hypothetical protein
MPLPLVEPSKFVLGEQLSQWPNCQAHPPYEELPEDQSQSMNMSPDISADFSLELEIARLLFELGIAPEKPALVDDMTSPVTDQGSANSSLSEESLIPRPGGPQSSDMPLPFVEPSKFFLGEQISQLPNFQAHPADKQWPEDQFQSMDMFPDLSADFPFELQEITHSLFVPATSSDPPFEAYESLDSITSNGPLTLQAYYGLHQVQGVTGDDFW